MLDSQEDFLHLIDGSHQFLGKHIVGRGRNQNSHKVKKESRSVDYNNP